MSLCDTCPKPGACCQDMAVFGRGANGKSWNGRVAVGDGWQERAVAELASVMPVHPFIPLRLQIEEPPAADAGVRWSCSNLLPSGRCGDYENRPALCADYEAGSDTLCVLYRGEPQPGNEGRYEANLAACEGSPA